MSAGTLGMHTIAGKTFKCTERTAAHLEHTIAELKAAHPKATLRIIQPCYNTTIAASAGTHDWDAVFDFEITGLGTGSAGWWAAQRFLRTKGWACWYRHTGTWSSEAAWHIHAISLGYPGKVGKYIDGGLSLYGRKVATSQVEDYYNHAFGLSNQHRVGSDTSWFPVSIKATVFDYDGYVARQSAAQSTYLDVTVALAQFAATSKNSNAVPVYEKARSIVGKLVSDGRRVRVPEDTAEVIAVLAAKRAASKNYWTRYRLTRAINLLKPLA